MAMVAWADRGDEQPVCEVPRVGEGTLVSLDEARAAFPSIPGVEFPTVLNELQVLDYGAEFGAQGGRLTLVPPIAGPSYRVLVPLPDQHRLAIPALRPIETRAPPA